MTQRAIGYRIAAVAATLVLLAACGSDNNATSSPATPVVTNTPAATPSASTSAEPSDQPSGEASAATVTVDETEFKIDLSTSTFKAGTYTFTVTNNGTIPHAFQIDGPGVADKGTGTIQPGADGTLTVTLQKGTYTFYCPVPGHEDKGMKHVVTVS